MNMWRKIKHWLCMKVWAGDPWCKLIDDIDQATEDINKGKYVKVILPLTFKWLLDSEYEVTITKKTVT